MSSQKKKDTGKQERACPGYGWGWAHKGSSLQEAQAGFLALHTRLP